jgi:hypothetical protein
LRATRISFSCATKRARRQRLGRNFRVSVEFLALDLVFRDGIQCRHESFIWIHNSTCRKMSSLRDVPWIFGASAISVTGKQGGRIELPPKRPAILRRAETKHLPDIAISLRPGILRLRLRMTASFSLATKMRPPGLGNREERREKRDRRDDVAGAVFVDARRWISKSTGRRAPSGTSPLAKRLHGACVRRCAT